MIYGNTGAGLGVVKPTVSPYADNVLPDVEKMKMAAYGVPEMEDIDYQAPQMGEGVDVEPQEFQEYSTLINKLQEAAIMGRQAGIDVTKPGQNPTAQEFSKEWFKMYNRAAELKNILQTSQATKKTALTQSQGANTITQPFGSEVLTPSRAQNVSYKADVELGTIRQVPKTLKYRLGYGNQTIEDYNQKYDEILGELDAYGTEIQNNPNIPDYAKKQLLGEVDMAKSQSFQMMPDEWKAQQADFAKQRIDISRGNQDIARQRLALGQANKGVIPEEEYDNYLAWFDELGKNGYSARALLNGVEIPITYDVDGVPTTKNVPVRTSTVEVIQGKPMLITKGEVDGNMKELIRYDLSDPSGGILDVYGNILKSKGTFGTTKQGTKVQTKTAAPKSPTNPWDKYKRK